MKKNENNVESFSTITSNTVHISTVIIILAAVFAILSIVGFPKLFDTSGPNPNPPIQPPIQDDQDVGKDNPTTNEEGHAISGFEKFESEEEFVQYLADAREISASSFGGGWGRMERSDMIMAAPTNAKSLGMIESSNETSGAGRVSDTNVQVVGIDEPDIIKTDGTNLFFSSEIRRYPNAFEEGIYSKPPAVPYPTALTNIIKAFPPAELQEIGEIEEGGNLLLVDNILAIFAQNKIYGFDVSDLKNPKKEWTVSLEDNMQYLQARLSDGKIYLVTRRNVNYSRLCPIRPFVVNDINTTEIRCGDIYHPSVITPADVTYTIATINPETGSMNTGISFVGSYNATVYMSQKGLYVAYSHNKSVFDFFAGFLIENKDIIPAHIITRLEKLQTYDLSDNAKMTEMGIIMNEVQQFLDGDEKLKMENEMENRMDSYVDAHKRDLEKTSIVKIDIESFKVQDIGIVPGHLLNQFSLDEYEENLRVAITIGGRNQFRWQYGIDMEEENDVYVLDEKMKTIGKVTGLGKDEKIYSVRFIGDRGYLVTFKQIDPFFVLDLSDPRNPQVTGELKIPGFSSYLHPISDNIILGIGREGSKVKMSLFDVSDPKNPTEVAKYMLNEYWSEIQNTHHAFLQDSKHEVFFMPGDQGGFVFSYKNNELKMVKAVSGLRARRAVYLDDYLYIIGDNKIVILNETDWQRVNELNLSE